jgi:group I intron endonuclease
VIIEGYKIFIYDIKYLERIKGLYGFVYVTTNLVNGKMYVGQRKLKYKNRKKWQTYLGSGTHLQNAIKKYGKENFDRKIIDIAFDLDELNYLEFFYTKSFNSVNKENWYNMIYGGGVDGLNINNNKQEPVIRYNMKGEIIGEYKSMLDGSAKTGDGRQSIFACCTGRQHKVGKSNTVWRYKEDPFDKYPIIDAKLKQINCYGKNESFIKTYESTHDGERQTGVNHSSISRCCKGRQQTAGGFKWYYSNDPNQPDKTKIII